MEDKRIYSLDLLKFLCAIIIIILHLQQETRLGLSVINLASGKICTWYVTELFFIISGFLSMSCFSTHEKNEMAIKKGFTSYFKHKAIRIYPMTILSILFTVFVSFLYRFFVGRWFHDLIPGLWRLLNTLMLTNVWVVSFDIFFNFPVWYLGVLLLCYIIQYNLFYLAQRFSLKIKYLCIILVLWGINAYCSNSYYLFLNPYTARGFSTFFLGCILYIEYYSGLLNNKIIVIISFSVLLLCTILGFFNFPVFYDDIICQWGIASFVLWPSIFIIFLELNKWFKSSKWQILGNISFEMYLWHMPFITLYLIYCNFCSAVHLSEMFQIIFFVVFMIIFSFFIYNFVEKPITKKLSNRFHV